MEEENLEYEFYRRKLESDMSIRKSVKAFKEYLVCFIRLLLISSDKAIIGLSENSLENIITEIYGGYYPETKYDDIRTIQLMDYEGKPVYVIRNEGRIEKISSLSTGVIKEFSILNLCDKYTRPLYDDYLKDIVCIYKKNDDMFNKLLFKIFSSYIIYHTTQKIL